MAYDQERKLLAQLSEDEFVTAGYLGKKLGVSERTVRTRMRSLEALMARHGARVISKRSAGYMVAVEDRATYNAFLGVNDASSRIPQTPEERSRRIVALLLESYGKYVSTESLAESLYVSNQTVYQNLDEAEQILATEGIVLERRPGYGVRAQGSEYAARNCIVNNLAGATSDARFPILMDGLHVIDEVAEYHTTDYNYADICRYVIVMLTRHAEGHLISSEELPEVFDRIVLAASELVVHMLEDCLGETIPTCEQSYLAVVLASKRSAYVSVQVQDDHVVSELVEEMIAGVWASFGVDLAQDRDFRQLLTEHLGRLRDRVLLGMQQRNPVLDQIRRDFGFAWAVSVQMAALASKRLGATITDDEVGFLALIFDMALEKVHLVSKGKTVLLVCPVGESSTRLVEYRWRAALGPLVSHIETTSAQRIDDFDLRTFSVILTTIDIAPDTKTPVIKVSLFPDNAEVERIRASLGRSRLPDSLAYFDEGRFVLRSGRRSLIEAIGEAARLAGMDGPWSTADALDNAVCQTGVLVVRPTLPACARPSCAVMVFERPLVWKAGHRVRALMFVSAGRALNDLGYFYQVLGRFLADAGGVGRLVRSADYQHFIEDWTQHAC